MIHNGTRCSDWCHLVTNHCMNLGRLAYILPYEGTLAKKSHINLQYIQELSDLLHLGYTYWVTPHLVQFLILLFDKTPLCHKLGSHKSFNQHCFLTFKTRLVHCLPLSLELHLQGQIIACSRKSLLPGTDEGLLHELWVLGYT